MSSEAQQLQGAGRCLGPLLAPASQATSKYGRYRYQLSGRRCCIPVHTYMREQFRASALSTRTILRGLCPIARLSETNMGPLASVCQGHGIGSRV